MESSSKLPLFKVTDLYWWAGLAFVMWNSGIWRSLSPRPEIGQVAVLWLPSAVLLVLVVRNWGRHLCIGMAVFSLFALGLLPALKDQNVLNSFLLLCIDVIEVGIIAAGLIRLGGRGFRLNSMLNVTLFAAFCMVTTLFTGVLAAIVSQIHVATGPISAKAPMQVGVAWFTSNLATYVFASSPLFALTGSNRESVITEFQRRPGVLWSGVVMVLVLTFLGHILPQWLLTKTGLSLGSGGLVLMAFPIAAYLAFSRGPVIAALLGAAIGIPTIYATMAGFGPFGHGDASANIFDMQATLIVCVFTLLLIGAMAEQLRERTRALERSLDQAIKRRAGELLD